ncbi:MAG: 2-C-methyl-D-erythritol 4-phosphate cytidylyltransferase [Pseudobutyrivibrio sp.]|nr:2-C-methyl-D-erythritol 4-phosphate cytidylyltransferase [Pseudobutyrivibrio sp.]
MNVGMIIAGGVGARLSDKMPKQYIKVLGKPVLAYTMEAFEHFEGIDEITVVCHPNYEEDIKKMAEDYGISKLAHIFYGGATGQESIRNGVFGLEKYYSGEDLILIHDAIRPLVDDEVLADCIRVAKEKGNAIVCIPCVTTMMQKVRDEYGEEGKGLECSDAIYPRDLIMETQTPQAFPLALLGAKHREALEKGILNETASCALMTRLGERVYFSKGSEKNIKITVPEDLDLMEALLRTKAGSWRKDNHL